MASCPRARLVDRRSGMGAPTTRWRFTNWLFGRASTRPDWWSTSLAGPRPCRCGCAGSLLELPQEVGKRGKRQVVLVLDEFQEIVALDPDLPARIPGQSALARS